MAIKQFNARITMKRDTASNWEQNNPVLLNGEIIIVDTASGEVRFKIGDGTKLYKQLPFSDEAVRALISAKEDKISLTENRAVISDASGKLSVSEVTSTELSYLDGVSSNLQTQINNKVPTTRKINSKPLSSDITLNASDVHALPSTTTIPSKTSQLTNDSGFITSSDIPQLSRASVSIANDNTSTIDIPITIVDPNYLTVYQNGLILTPTTHYTATTTAITLVGYTADAGDIFTFVGTAESGASLNSSASEVLFSDTTEDGAYSGCTTVQDALIHAAGFKSDVQSISVNGVEIPPVDGSVNISGVVKSISVNGTDVPIDQNGQASITGVVKSISVNGTTISIDSSGSASITGLVKTISVNGTNINVDNTGAVAITGLVKSLSLNGTSYTPNSSGVLSLTNIMKTNTDQTMSAKLIAQNNTDYTTAQLRNVIISTQDPSGGNNGDIWIKYTV